MSERKVLERFSGVMSLAMMELAQELGGVALLEETIDEIKHELNLFGSITPISLSRLESKRGENRANVFDRFDDYVRLDEEVCSQLDDY